MEFLGRRYPELIDAARERLAAYVGARADDLVFVPNATTGINMVSRSLELKPGDDVVATTHEYGGTTLMWRHLCERAGARYVEVDTWPATAVDDLLGAVTPRTRVIAVSHITSPTALCFPVEEICSRAREAGVLTVVDGAHAPGHVSVAVEAIGADVYAGNCHKWLCSPKGAAFLYVREEHHALVEPLIVSWDSVEEGWNNRQRWTGTHDPAAYLSVPAAIDFQAEHGWDDVRRRCHALASRAARELTSLLGTEAFAASEDEYAQMVAVRMPPCNVDAVAQRLFDEHKVEVVVQDWRGEPSLRASFQGYNDDSDLDALLEALPRALK